MSSLETAILAQVQQLLARAGAGPSPSFIPSPKVPTGLTLRNTYTSSASGLSYPNEWVYVIAVGGGGGGSVAGGGGGGACIQGWVKSVDLTAVTIGAGSNSGLRGNPTIAGPVRAPGGGGSNSGNLTHLTSALAEPGAGQGAHQRVDSIGAPGIIVEPSAYGIFQGGRTNVDQMTEPLPATSGAGATEGENPQAKGGDGLQGPGGGGAKGPSSGTVRGGSSFSPNGSIYLGGTGHAGSPSGGGGGGAGILAAGGNAPAISGGIGGNGGSGGGGGGGGGSTGGGSTGGNGAVLIYY